jgi:hypothetical protein
MTADDRLDRLVNIDIGGRGAEKLYDATRAKLGVPLARAAAEKLAAVPESSLVLMTTGSVSRAWISAEICENDGPAGVAVVARALALGRRAIPGCWQRRRCCPQSARCCAPRVSASSP